MRLSRASNDAHDYGWFMVWIWSGYGLLYPDYPQNIRINMLKPMLIAGKLSFYRCQTPI
jgi:hypothetical protein